MSGKVAGVKRKRSEDEEDEEEEVNAGSSAGVGGGSSSSAANASSKGGPKASKRVQEAIAVDASRVLAKVRELVVKARADASKSGECSRGLSVAPARPGLTAALRLLTRRQTKDAGRARHHQRQGGV
jgi:hypothetical protein